MNDLHPNGPAELHHRRTHRRLTDHLADSHDIHRIGTAGQLTHWHATAHWLACTPNHDPTDHTPEAAR